MSHKTMNLETLYYDEKARADFFEGYDKIIQWCKDFGFLKAASDHTKTRNRILSEIAELDA